MDPIIWYQRSGLPTRGLEIRQPLSATTGGAVPPSLTTTTNLSVHPPQNPPSHLPVSSNKMAQIQTTVNSTQQIFAEMENQLDFIQATYGLSPPPSYPYSWPSSYESLTPYSLPQPPSIPRPSLGPLAGPVSSYPTVSDSSTCQQFSASPYSLGISSYPYPVSSSHSYPCSYYQQPPPSIHYSTPSQYHSPLTSPSPTQISSASLELTGSQSRVPTEQGYLTSTKNSELLTFSENSSKVISQPPSSPQLPSHSECRSAQQVYLEESLETSRLLVTQTEENFIYVARFANPEDEEDVVAKFYGSPKEVALAENDHNLEDQTSKALDDDVVVIVEFEENEKLDGDCIRELDKYKVEETSLSYAHMMLDEMTHQEAQFQLTEPVFDEKHTCIKYARQVFDELLEPEAVKNDDLAGKDRRSSKTGSGYKIGVSLGAFHYTISSNPCHTNIGHGLMQESNSVLIVGFEQELNPVGNKLVPRFVVTKILCNASKFTEAEDVSVWSSFIKLYSTMSCFELATSAYASLLDPVLDELLKPEVAEEDVLTQLADAGNKEEEEHTRFDVKSHGSAVAATPTTTVSASYNPKGLPHITVCFCIENFIGFVLYFKPYEPQNTPMETTKITRILIVDVEVLMNNISAWTLISSCDELKQCDVVLELMNMRVNWGLVPNISAWDIPINERNQALDLWKRMITDQALITGVGFAWDSCELISMGSIIFIHFIKDHVGDFEEESKLDHLNDWITSWWNCILVLIDSIMGMKSSMCYICKATKIYESMSLTTDSCLLCLVRFNPPCMQQVTYVVLYVVLVCISLLDRLFMSESWEATENFINGMLVYGLHHISLDIELPNDSYMMSLLEEMGGNGLMMRNGETYVIPMAHEPKTELFLNILMPLLTVVSQSKILLQVETKFVHHIIILIKLVVFLHLMSLAEMIEVGLIGMSENNQKGRKLTLGEGALRSLLFIVLCALRLSSAMVGRKSLATVSDAGSCYGVVNRRATHMMSLDVVSLVYSELEEFPIGHVLTLSLDNEKVNQVVTYGAGLSEVAFLHFIPMKEHCGIDAAEKHYVGVIDGTNCRLLHEELHFGLTGKEWATCCTIGICIPINVKRFPGGAALGMGMDTVAQVAIGSDVGALFNYILPSQLTWETHRTHHWSSEVYLFFFFYANKDSGEDMRYTLVIVTTINHKLAIMFVALYHTMFKCGNLYHLPNVFDDDLAKFQSEVSRIYDHSSAAAMFTHIYYKLDVISAKSDSVDGCVLLGFSKTMKGLAAMKDYLKIIKKLPMHRILRLLRKIKSARYTFFQTLSGWFPILGTRSKVSSGFKQLTIVQGYLGHMHM